MQVMWSRRCDGLGRWWGVSRTERAGLVLQWPWQLDGHNVVAKEGRVEAEERNHHFETGLPWLTHGHGGRAKAQNGQDI